MGRPGRAVDEFEFMTYLVYQSVRKDGCRSVLIGTNDWYRAARNAISGFRAHPQEFPETISSSKVVVITGCSNGFGERAVNAFADKGYRVWGTLRDAQGRNAAKKTVLEAYASKVSTHVEILKKRPAGEGALPGQHLNDVGRQQCRRHGHQHDTARDSPA